MQSEPQPIATLPDVRAFVAEATGRLDPASRYITELLAIVDASSDVADLEARLDRGCRGRYWAGEETFSRMSLREKLQVNLITNESQFMRFEVGELSFLRETVIPWLDGTRGRICSLPSANGEEAVSLAIECVEAGVTPFDVRGFDIQRACVETARTGRIPVSGLPKYVVGLVDERIRRHLSFDVADVFVDAIPGPFELVVCRNFLGYFQPEVVAGVLDTLQELVVWGGFLMLDEFILGKHPELFDAFPFTRLGEFPFFRIRSESLRSRSAAGRARR
ncbi:MAG: hypothetical protein KDA28_11535 [Phycisphaerales bacterium]|nr:hypothetical protein [Phycisphaerales bacterium]